MRVLRAGSPCLRRSVKPSARMFAGKYPADNASREVMAFLAFLLTKQLRDSLKEKPYTTHSKPLMRVAFRSREGDFHC